MAEQFLYINDEIDKVKYDTEAVKIIGDVDYNRIIQSDVDDITFCPHHPDKGYPEENPVYKIKCECRKPGIRMIRDMEEKYNIDLSRSYMIGDTTVDVQTGVNAGLHTVLLHTGEGGNDGKYDVVPEYEADNLLGSIKTILQKEG